MCRYYIYIYIFINMRPGPDALLHWARNNVCFITEPQRNQLKQVPTVRRGSRDRGGGGGKTCWEYNLGPGHKDSRQSPTNIRRRPLKLARQSSNIPERGPSQAH